MPSWSRRAALRAAGTVALAGLTGLAGCSGQSRSSHAVPVAPDKESVTDYTMVQVHTADPTPLFWRDGDPPDDGDPGRTMHVTSTEERSDVTYAPDVPAARRLARFVRNTDLGSRSVYLHAQRLAACYDLVLQGVSRDDSSVHVDLCRDLKPADASCTVDDQTGVGLAIRLPFPGDDFHGHGMGYGSQCDRHRRRQPVDFGPRTPAPPDNRSGGEDA